MYTMLNEGARHVFGLENARNDKRRCFMNPFGGLLERFIQGILKKERNVSTSVIRTNSLILYHRHGHLGQRCPDYQGCTVLI